jgi:UDP-3-O-[3-hydroxymyristoyl] glucosamine N-acyltransferase
MIFGPIKTNDVLKILKSFETFTFDDFEVCRIANINSLESDSILFISDTNTTFLEKHFKKNILIVTEKKNPQLKNNFIIVNNSRLALGEFLHHLYRQISYQRDLSFVSNNTKIDFSVIIEPFVFIGENVVIGKDSVIKSGSKISSNSVIGENCIIKENAVIGNQGFGIEKDKDSNNFKIHHIGGVIIGNNVEIGSSSTINCGTIENTIIEDYVKIDDNVHVAHNCIISSNTIITSGVIIGGSTVIGSNCWIGLSAVIKNGIKLANRTFIAAGANVTKSILMENKVFIGNPAIEINEYIKINKPGL